MRKGRVKKAKVVLKKKAVKKTAPKTKKVRAVKKITRSQAKKVINREQEVAINTAKFSHAKAVYMQDTSARELPSSYNQDKMVLVVRDPWWLFSYWEVRGETWERHKRDIGDEFYKGKIILRVYDVSSINFNGFNAHRHFDIYIRPESSSWYIDISTPGKSWCVDLGILLSNGRFITILRSNVVETPLDGPSWITDEEWMIPDDTFFRLYGMGFGLGKSSVAGAAWRKGIISSPGMASMASPVKKAPFRNFWLEVNCELIVYGATEPDAKVSVQGKPINLRKDGTFTMRFALPDGKQVIPVEAVSADKKDKRTITPIVKRETK